MVGLHTASIVSLYQASFWLCAVTGDEYESLLTSLFECTSDIGFFSGIYVQGNNLKRFPQISQFPNRLGQLYLYLPIHTSLLRTNMNKVILFVTFSLLTTVPILINFCIEIDGTMEEDIGFFLPDSNPGLAYSYECSASVITSLIIRFSGYFRFVIYLVFIL